MVTETQERQILASFGVFWVYVVAQSEGDFGAASSALSFFQRSWPSTRSALVAYFARADESLIPRALPVNGAWSADVRVATQALTLATLGDARFPESEENAFPTTAGGIASWFNTRFDRLVQGALPTRDLDTLSDFEALIDEGVGQLPQGLQAMTQQVLSGVSIGEPEVIRTGNDPAREVIRSTGSADALADAADAATEDAGTAITAGGTTYIDVPETLIFGKRSTASTWQYLVIGAGALAFGGLAYWFWRARNAPRSRLAGLGRPCDEKSSRAAALRDLNYSYSSTPESEWPSLDAKIARARARYEEAEDDCYAIEDAGRSKRTKKTKRKK